jgi:hypothetical protein
VIAGHLLATLTNAAGGAAVGTAVLAHVLERIAAAPAGHGDHIVRPFSAW